MANTIEEITEEIITSIINKKLTKKSADNLIIWLGEKKNELDREKVELQTSLEQAKKLIRDLVKDRAAFFVSSETTSEVGEREESEFVINFPEQSEHIEQLFQKSLEELITKKEELEVSLKELIVKINEIARDKEKLEKELEFEKYGKNELNDLEMKKESTNWRQAELRNKLAEQRQKIRDRKVMSKNSELENKQLEKQFYLLYKPLPKIPSKFKQLGAKIKESAEKVEVSSQKLITKIEVKTK